MRSMRMKKLRIPTIVIVLLSLIGMLGCNPASAITPAAPTNIPLLETSTPLPPPTVESVAQAFSTPETLTPTPEPSLRTNGPYFAYFRNVDGVYQLVMMDADGRGRKVIDLPEEMSNCSPCNDYNINHVSPNGKWLVFYSGFAGHDWYEENIGNGPFDLTLNLLDLSTGKTRVVTPLLSKDYPGNFNDEAKQLSDPNITSLGLQSAFLSGITWAIAWSPDGRYLAFAGQMDGLSSDLYVYDMQAQKIQHLSSGDQELQWIKWSPDGKYILHGSAFWAGEGVSFDVYAAAVDGSSVRKFSSSTGGGGIQTWLSSRKYFEYDAENGLGLYGLRLVDIDTGEIIKLWDGSFDSYAADTNGKWVAVLVRSLEPSIDFDPNFIPAIYLVNLATMKKSRIEIPDNSHKYVHVNAFGSEQRDFVLFDLTSNAPVFLSLDGKFTSTDLYDSTLSISLDLKYWLADSGINAKVFSADNTMLRDFSIPIQDQGKRVFSWSPDSTYVMLIAGSKLYAVNVSTGDVILLDEKLSSDSYSSTYTWTNGQ